MAAASVIAAGAGGAAGVALRGGTDGADGAAGAQPQVAATDRFRLPLPTGWVPVERRSLPGYGGGSAELVVRAGGEDVAITAQPATHASLLPASVLEPVGGDPPAPRTQRIGTRVVWRYDLPRTGATGARTDVYVLPTTGGSVTVACPVDVAVTPGANRCEEAIRTLELVKATPVLPQPETAALLALPRITAQLNAARGRARVALAAARTPQSRAAAASALAAAYEDAANALRPLLGGRAAALGPLLDGLRRHHLALAAASAQRRPAGARRAGRAVARDEQRLRALLAGFSPDSD